MLKRLLLFLSFCFVSIGVALGQNITVKGTVLDENNDPVMGATVRLKNDATKGAITDMDGRFTLQAKTGELILITYVGYKDQEVKAAPTLSITLVPNDQLLDEVMVVAYGTSKKSSFTGSATSVNADQLTTSKTESVDKALAGRLSGVQVASPTGDPGSAGKIQIRGIGSITGNTQPLYVIDGIPVNTGKYGFESDGGANMSSDILSTLNPEDVESMTVLKDAAAASLYGSRAANGVIIITTKKGKMGKPSINFKSTFGWSNLATRTNEVMNASEFVDFFRDGLVGGYLFDNNALLPTQENFGNKSILAEAEAFADKNAMSPDWTFVTSRDTKTDWRKEVYPGGNQQDYSLSLNGGSEKLRYFASLGYSDIKGVTRNSAFKRYTSLLNLNANVTKWLDLSFKNQMSYSRQEGLGDKANQYGSIPTKSPSSLYWSSLPSELVYNEDGSYNNNANMNGNVKNAVRALDPSEESIDLDTYRMTNDIGAKLTFTEWLTFNSNNSVDWFLTRGLNYWSPKSVDGASVNGLGERQNYIVTTFTTSNFFNLNKTFDEVHNLALTVGQEYQNYIEALEWMGTKSYSSSILKELENGQPDSAGSSRLTTEMLSFFGNADYNFDNRYYVGASLRSDTSSKLGKNNRQGIFWSASASWRFGQEAFLKDNGFLTDGKIRFSYGTNGNLPALAYGHLGLFYMGGSYNDQSAIYMDQIENSDLGWEKSRNMNVGLDLTFADRFNFTVEYFDKYTTDLLLDVPISWFTGATDGQMTKNVGEISNRGIEVEFHGRNILNTDPFTWNMDFTFTNFKSKVEKLPEGDILAGHSDFYIYREGEEMYTYYLPTYVGVEKETGLAQFLIDPEKPATKDNLTYIYREAGKTLQGRGYANINGGWTNTFSYKGLSLSALITYQFGGTMFDYAGYFLRHNGFRVWSFLAAKDVVGNYWKAPGDDVRYPRPVVAVDANFYGDARPDMFSTNTLFSTDFIRMKEISLSYQLPAKWLKPVGLASASLSLTGTNLFYIYSATPGQEVEVALNGYRGTDTPLARTFLFGINFGF